MLLGLYLGCALLGGTVALLRQPQPARGWPLLALASLPQLLAISGLRHSALTLISLALCLAWCWRNRSLPGISWAAIGLSLNLGLMAWYGGAMPVMLDTLSAHGFSATPGQAILGMKDVVVASSPLWWLSDWIGVPSPLGTWLISPGDLFVALGLLRWLSGPAALTHEKSNASSPDSDCARALQTSNAPTQ
jgi:Family of unknown function (DUF5317)